MTKVELKKHCEAARRKMKTKGWKIQLSPSNLIGYPKKITDTMWHGGIYKGAFYITVNKDHHGCMRYCAYVNNETLKNTYKKPHACVASVLSVQGEDCPEKVFQSQKKKLKEEMTLLKNYLTSVK